MRRFRNEGVVSDQKRANTERARAPLPNAFRARQTAGLRDVTGLPGGPAPADGSGPRNPSTAPDTGPGPHSRRRVRAAPRRFLAGATAPRTLRTRPRPLPAGARRLARCRPHGPRQCAAGSSAAPPAAVRTTTNLSSGRRSSKARAPGPGRSRPSPHAGRRRSPAGATNARTPRRGARPPAAPGRFRPVPAVRSGGGRRDSRVRAPTLRTPCPGPSPASRRRGGGPGRGRGPARCSRRRRSGRPGT